MRVRRRGEAHPSVVGRPQTLLRSLAVTPSSSRQGSLCTNASIWYLALMNSDLMGLRGAHRRKWGAGQEASHPATSQAHVPDHAAPATTPPARLTGLCLEGWLCAGRSALVQGPAENAPRWSWPHCWRACAPSAGRRCQVREPTASWAPAAASVAANSTEGPTVCLIPLHLHPVRPPKDVGPL